MRHGIIIILFISIHLLSCKHVDKDGTKGYIVTSGGTINNINSNDKDENRINKSNATNFESNIFHHSFSDMTKQDTFKLILIGDSLLSGQIDFQVWDYNGKQIFNEIFEASDLLGDQADIIPNIKQKKDTIAKRIKDFFAENNFVQPAIGTTDTYNSDDTDKEIWDDIKSDKTSIGFIYSYGYEFTYGIAYSKKKQKVVNYFTTD